MLFKKIYIRVYNIIVSIKMYFLIYKNYMKPLNRGKINVKMKIKKH